MKKFFLTAAIFCASCAFADGEEPKENTECEAKCEATWVCVPADQVQETVGEATLAYANVKLFQSCGADCDCNGDVCTPPKQED